MTTCWGWDFWVPWRSFCLLIATEPPETVTAEEVGVVGMYTRRTLSGCVGSPKLEKLTDTGLVGGKESVVFGAVMASPDLGEVGFCPLPEASIPLTWGWPAGAL